MDYNSDLLSNLGRQATIFLIHDFKTRVGMFKIMGGNIPGGNLLGGNFPDGNFPRGGEFDGWGFFGWEFSWYHIFLSTSVITFSFHYFIFCFKFYFPIADIIVSDLYIFFLCSRKTNTKYYSKKRKISVARNTVVTKNNIGFWSLFD